MTAMMYIVAGICIVLAIGGMIWYFFFCNKEDTEKKENDKNG